MTLASVFEPTLSTPPAQRSLASMRGSPASSARGMISDAPKLLQIGLFFRPPGRGDDAIAELGQDRDRDRADAARCARDDDGAFRRRDARIFEREHAEHRGVAGRADRHRLRRREFLRQRYEPVAFHPRQLASNRRNAFRSDRTR